MRIGIVAPGGTLKQETVPALLSLVAANYGPQVEVVFHPQCFNSKGHFAGSDEERLAAFLEVANDPSFDVLWFGRGGYGSVRIAEQAMAGLGAVAYQKIYMGYSDAGVMLTALYNKKIGSVFHGPMPCDILLDRGEDAVRRSIDFFLTRNKALLEPSIRNEPTAAFNLTILSSIVGTPLEPDLSGHVVMLEEIGEYLYRIDRTLAHLLLGTVLKKAAGVRLGRCLKIPENDPDFRQTEVDITRFWCDKVGVPYLGRADIGHDVDNKIVPFGCYTRVSSEP